MKIGVCSILVALFVLRLQQSSHSFPGVAFSIGLVAIGVGFFLGRYSIPRTHNYLRLFFIVLIAELIYSGILNTTEQFDLATNSTLLGQSLFLLLVLDLILKNHVAKGASPESANGRHDLAGPRLAASMHRRMVVGFLLGCVTNILVILIIYTLAAFTFDGTCTPVGFTGLGAPSSRACQFMDYFGQVILALTVIIAVFLPIPNPTIGAIALLAVLPMTGAAIAFFLHRRRKNDA